MRFTHSEGYLTFITDSDVFRHFNYQDTLIRAIDGQWDLSRSSPAFVDNDYCDNQRLMLHCRPAFTICHTQSCTLKSDRRELCGGKFIRFSAPLFYAASNVLFCGKSGHDFLKDDAFGGAECTVPVESCRKRQKSEHLKSQNN